MLSRILIFVFAMFALAILYYAWTYEGDYSIWLVVLVVLCAVTIVMAPQIDWWWISKYPPKTPIPIKKMFEAKSNYFRQIDNSLKDFYFHRVEMFYKAFDWIPQGYDTIPGDVQYVLCGYAAQLTMNKDKFLFKHWEKIVLYKHPFPSPQFPKALHNSEIFQEDNVMLYNIEAVMLGFLEPYTHFPVGLYEMSRAYCETFKLQLIKDENDFNTEHAELISGKAFDWVTSGIGLNRIDMNGVAIVFYFLFHENLQKYKPELFAQCTKVFG